MKATNKAKTLGATAVNSETKDRENKRRREQRFFLKKYNVKPGKLNFQHFQQKQSENTLIPINSYTAI